MNPSGGPVRFADGKEPDAMRTIGEVAKAFGLKPHVLRYWEENFPNLRPLKRSGGRRLYRPEDVALVARIDQMVNREGYTLKGAKLAMAKPASGLSEAIGPETTGPETTVQVSGEIVARLRSIRERLATALAA